MTLTWMWSFNQWVLTVVRKRESYRHGNATTSMWCSTANSAMRRNYFWSSTAVACSRLCLQHSAPLTLNYVSLQVTALMWLRVIRTSLSTQTILAPPRNPTSSNCWLVSAFWCIALCGVTLQWSVLWTLVVGTSAMQIVNIPHYWWIWFKNC